MYNNKLQQERRELRLYELKREFRRNEWKNGPWYKIPNIYQETLKISKAILEKYPLEQHRIFSLGQTPAWFIKGSELLSRESKKNSFGIIAFSGNFLEKTNILGIFRASSDNAIPGNDSIANYRQYLTSISMDPETIIKLWETKNIKTVIVDYVDTGLGLASFMFILCQWAQELGKLQELKAAIKLLALKDKSRLQDLEVFGTDVFFQLDTIKFSDATGFFENYGYYNILQVFYNLSNPQDRMVPHYPAAKWNEPPQQQVINQKILKELAAAAAPSKSSLFSRLFSRI